MTKTLLKSWWIILLRGMISLFFGVVLWLQLEVTVAIIVKLFGLYVIADGVFGAYQAFAERKRYTHWWVLLLWGIAAIAIGVLVFKHADVTVLFLMYYMAAWALITGLCQIVLAVLVKRVFTGEWRLFLAGILSCILGVTLFFYPNLGVVLLGSIISLYSMFFGLLLILFAFNLKRFRKLKCRF